MLLQFSQTQDAQLVIVNNARIDMAVSREFKDRLLENVDASKKTVIIDFNNVEYCDSSGLGSLVAIHRELHKTGKIMQLSRLQPTIKTLIKLAKLDGIFNIVEDHRDFS